MKCKKIMILVVMLCVSLLTAPFAFAQDTTASQGGHFKAVADERQLETLNSLYNTDISFGELIETVYPEALKHIPEPALKDMYNTKVIWPDEDTRSSIETTSQQADINPRQVILVGHESNISAGQTINFDSGSRVWLPTPFYRIPYMSALSTLERQGVGIVASALEFDTDIYGISASGSYRNPPSGNYRTVGYHAGTYPPNHTPPGYSKTTATGWRVAP